MAFLLALLLAGAGALALSNVLPFAANRRLCGRLAGRLASEHLAVGPQERLLVGLSPGAAPRIFESNYAWDLGALVFERDRLCYWGEEVRFALERREVLSVERGPGFPSWFRTRFLYVTALGTGGRPFTFNLRPFDVSSALEMKRSLAELERRLERWRGATEAAAPPAHPEPGPLRIGEVTSIDPSEAWKAGQGLTLVVLVAFLAGFVASLAKLPVEWVAPPAFAPASAAGDYAGISGWYAVLASAACMLVFFGPMWFVRRPKEPRLEPVPPPPVPAEGSRPAD